MAQTALTKAYLADRMREAGIVGAGGAGFPSYAKLSEQADTLIVNCAECEPLLQLHRQLLARHAADVLSGAAAVADALGITSIRIGVKEEYVQAVEAVRHEMRDPRMQLCLLGAFYPMGDEVALIYEATGRVVPPGGLPIACGVIVFNVETLFNVSRALKDAHPVTEKLITVGGEVKSPGTFRVPIGMPLSEVLLAAGGQTVSDARYLLGGPMMGRYGSLSEPVTKTSSALIVLPSDHVLYYRKNPNLAHGLNRAEASCCQCRTCTDLCPRYALGHPIQPHLFMRAASLRDVRDTKPFLDTFFCCGCGICELYACPQGLSPRSLIQAAKAGMRNAGIAAPGAEAAPVISQRNERRTPEGRLTARLGLLSYDVPAPLDDTLQETTHLRLLLSQHIGAPSVPLVQTGETVAALQKIADSPDGLGVALHSPFDGVVTRVDETAIEIAVRNV